MVPLLGLEPRIRASQARAFSFGPQGRLAVYWYPYPELNRDFKFRKLALSPVELYGHLTQKPLSIHQLQINTRLTNTERKLALNL